MNEQLKLFTISIATEVAETGSGNRALAGLSMGGIQTLYVGIKNTEIFSFLGFFSSRCRMPVQNDLYNFAPFINTA